MSIPTPPDLAEGRVTWTIGRGSSRALEAGRGVVRFRPSAVAANFSTASALLEPVETPVLAGVMTPVDLIQNDPEVWNWVVEPLVGVQWEPFPIDVDGPVDLATAAQTPGKGPVRAVKGETGPGLTGEVRYQDGEVEFRIEDGSWTAPVTMPPGPPGPGNTLQIGTVSTSAAGGNAEASISGESPTQYLNLALPRGDKPAISWQGSTIVVDGALGPDLRGATGQDSTVPGPANELSIGTVSTGVPGSQAAVTITGTAPNQTLGFAIPRGDQGVRGPAGNVKIERPEPGVWDFQPEELDVQVSDVQGLADRLAALEYDSGWRNVANLLGPGLSLEGNYSFARVRRVSNELWVEMNATVNVAGIDLLLLPSDWLPASTGLGFRQYTLLTDTRPARTVPATLAAGYVQTSPSPALRAASTPPVGGTVAIPLTKFPLDSPIPTTLPGTPA